LRKRRRTLGSAPVQEKDRLLVVSHHENVAVIPRETMENGVLERVQILGFIHQDVRPPRRDLARHVRPGANQLLGPHHQIIEVQQSSGLENLLIPFKKFGGVVAQRLAEDFVLAEILKGPGGRVAVACAAQHLGLVLLVRDSKALGEPDRGAVFPEQLYAQGMNRRAGDLIRREPQ
jgi:hypothetical protein